MPRFDAVAALLEAQGKSEIAAVEFEKRFGKLVRGGSRVNVLTPPVPLPGSRRLSIAANDVAELCFQLGQDFFGARDADVEHQLSELHFRVLPAA